MLKSTSHRNRFVGALVVIMVVALSASCGTKKETEPASTEKATTSESQGGYGQMKSQASPDTAQAADWSAYSNPKAGVCPVCQMTLNPAYVEEVTIEGKKYACCSARCVATLSESPDEYLSAAASTEDTHEGHDHGE
jgi:YHS domain-containing protein